MKIRVREASLADAAAIARVHVDIRRTAYADILSDDNLADFSYADSEQIWKEALTNDQPATSMLVAETAGEVIGFAFGRPEREGSQIYRGELFALYVLDQYQRLGVGRHLFSTVAQHFLMHGINSMLLWVFKDNHHARRIYESMGGEYLEQKTVTIDRADVVMVSYGWKDIADLVNA